jgi:hypothetical protein
MRKFYENEGEAEEENKKKLFIYPDFAQGFGVFSYEDLGFLSILVCPEDDSLNVFVCRENEFEGSDEDIGGFLENILQTHFDHFKPEKMVIKEEKADSPSEEFL